MAIESTCDGCGVQLRVADEHAGRQARCPQCGNLYTVPTANSAVPPVGGPTARPTAANPGPEQIESAAIWQMQTPEGQIYGPVTKDTLDQWTREGRLSTDCQVRTSDSDGWRSAAEIYPQLKTPPVSAEPANPFRENPYAPASSPARSFSEPHRGVLVLVFGILGFLVCPFFGIAAWLMGQSDLKKMSNNRMDPEGRVLTQVGMVLGIIQTVILSLVVLWFLLMIVFAMVGAM